MKVQLILFKIREVLLDVSKGNTSFYYETKVIFLLSKYCTFNIGRARVEEDWQPQHNMAMLQVKMKIKLCLYFVYSRDRLQHINVNNR